MITNEVINEAANLIGSFVIERRKALGLTQKQLADRAGLGIATVKRVELGKFVPDGKSLLKLCAALDCYFFFAEKESNEPLVTAMRKRWGDKIGN